MAWTCPSARWVWGCEAAGWAGNDAPLVSTALSPPEQSAHFAALRLSFRRTSAPSRQPTSLSTCQAAECVHSLNQTCFAADLPQDKGAIQAAKKRAEELGARVEYASKHDLNMVADNRPHQVSSFVASGRSCGVCLQAQSDSMVADNRLHQVFLCCSCCCTAADLTRMSGALRLDCKPLALLLDGRWQPPQPATTATYHLQGVVLDCSPLEFEPLPSLPDAPEGPAAGGRLPVWLCLDEVMDPVSPAVAIVQCIAVACLQPAGCPLETCRLPQRCGCLLWDVPARRLAVHLLQYPLPCTRLTP